MTEPGVALNDLLGHCDAEHPAPACSCRCGLYAAIEGTLDSLPGYLSDSAHDRDPPIHGEVACTGRVFVDSRGVRAPRIEILQLATSASPWPDPGLQARLSRNSASDAVCPSPGGGAIPLDLALGGCRRVRGKD